MHSLCSRERKGAIGVLCLTFETSLRLGQIYEQQKALPGGDGRVSKPAQPQRPARQSRTCGARLRTPPVAPVASTRSSFSGAGRGKRAATCEETTMLVRPGPADQSRRQARAIEVRAQP